MFIPYMTEVYLRRGPYANVAIILFTIGVFALVNLGIADIEYFLLDGLNATLVSSALMHADWLHLLSNMFYLFLFGNAVCARLGSATYAATYFALAICASIVHLIVSDMLAVGASGAVSGVVGMFLFLYPKAEIHCRFLVVWGFLRHFKIRAYWLILGWLVADIAGLISGPSQIAHGAHIGGILFGYLIASAMYKVGWIQPCTDYKSMREILEVAN